MGNLKIDLARTLYKGVTDCGTIIQKGIKAGNSVVANAGPYMYNGKSAKLITFAKDSPMYNRGIDQSLLVRYFASDGRPYRNELCFFKNGKEIFKTTVKNITETNKEGIKSVKNFLKALDSIAKGSAKIV